MKNLFRDTFLAQPPQAVEVVEEPLQAEVVGVVTPKMDYQPVEWLLARNHQQFCFRGDRKLDFLRGNKVQLIDKVYNINEVLECRITGEWDFEIETQPQSQAVNFHSITRSIRYLFSIQNNILYIRIEERFYEAPSEEPYLTQPVGIPVEISL